MTIFIVFSIVYLFTANTIYVVLTYLASKHLKKQKLYKQSVYQPVSIIVPAYNEEITIFRCISSLLKLNYPLFEIIVINDGSKDQMLSKLIKQYQLVKESPSKSSYLPTKEVNNIYRSSIYTNLVVIDKANGGKSDALNCGINHSLYPLICCIDADSIVTKNSLLHAVVPFYEQEAVTVATGGVVRVLPKQTSILASLQTVEYIRAFLVGRVGWDSLNATTIISGAFGVFRKSVILRVGGYRVGTIGEDLDLVLRIHQYFVDKGRYREIKFLANPVCKTEAPTDMQSLKNQRVRWMQGLVQSLWSSRQLLLSGDNVGNLAIPYLWIFEVLSAPIELISYVVVIVGLVSGYIQLDIAILFFCISFVYGIILTIAAIRLEKRKFGTYGDYWRLYVFAVLEQFGYRQLNMCWRLLGLFRELRGSQSWGEIRRDANVASN